MTVHIIPLPWTNPPLSGNRTRGNPHARANEVKVAKGEAQEAIRAARLPKLTGANVTLCLRVADKRRRDADNLAPTLKAVQDALVLEGIVPDDSWVHIPSATVHIHPPNGEGASMWLALESLGQMACHNCLDPLTEPADCPDRHTFEDHCLTCMGQCSACQHRLDQGDDL